MHRNQRENSLPYQERSACVHLYLFTLDLANRNEHRTTTLARNGDDRLSIFKMQLPSA